MWQNDAFAETRRGAPGAREGRDQPARSADPWTTPAAVAAHYNDLDRFYREIWGEHVHHGLWITGRESPEEAALQLSRRVAVLGGIAPGDRVCDIGCGYGGTARLLAEEFGARVDGITISRRQHEVAVAKRSGSSPRFHHSDWLANSFGDGEFDCAIALESSEHFADKPAFFAEAARVLRPGGTFVVCAWLAAPQAASWQRRHLLDPICREGRMPALNTAGQYRGWFERAGFMIREVQDVSRHVRRTWRVCAARLARKLAVDSEYRRFLFDRSQPNRVFALTLFRILAAYGCGAMRYGIFAASREGRGAA